MQITVEVTKESYIKSTKAFWLHSYKRLLIGLLIVSLFFSLISDNNNVFDFKAFAIKAIYIFIAGLFIIILIFFLRVYRSFKRSVKSIGDNTLLQVFTLQENGIIINASITNTLYQWFQIKKVYLMTDFIGILLYNNITYVIPKSAFDSFENENKFVQAIRFGKLSLTKANFNEMPALKPPFYWGWLGLIPIVGAVNGMIMIASGLSKYKNTKYVLVGVSGILFTVLAGVSFLYYENGESLTNGNFLRRGSIGVAQIELNSLVKEIEFYKLQKGTYPDSLQQLGIKDSFTSIYDPLLDGKKNMIFNYHRIGSKYTLFSSGIDQIPNTADDIYPSIKIDTSKIGLIVRKK